ncbi:hypothetical protein SAMN04488563_5451 [Jiangella alkaliphila]|uniref:TrbL/VirB6 plasmid conjugal transfer protein n=2 Tax=Jiangella alkaliphila TaxID=419479 RepID=A0A1H2L807_9ACTN|nr:hypothetical protein SAMN04488563_5451 [Jiangella alkaliphila]
MSPVETPTGTRSGAGLRAGVCDVPVISAVCDTVGEGAATLVTAPFEWLATAMGQAAGTLVEAVWSVIDTTTLVDVRSPGYLAVYNLLFGLAVLLTLVFFCFQVITGLVRRDPTALSRAGLGVAKAVLGGFLAITLTGLLLEITDQLAVGIVQAAGTSMAELGERVVLLTAALATVDATAAGMSVVIVLVLSGLAIVAAVAVWFSLLIRKALLLVAIVFAPVALAGSSWDATRGWLARWATFVVALIVSKLVLVVIFLVAVTQVSSPIEGDLASISDPITGVALLMLAAFAPYLSYKMISFAGIDAHQATASEQEAKGAVLPRPAIMAGLGGRTAAAILTNRLGGSGRAAQQQAARPGGGASAAGAPDRASTSVGPGGTAAAAPGPDGATQTGPANERGSAGGGPATGNDASDERRPGGTDRTGETGDGAAGPDRPSHGEPADRHRGQPAPGPAGWHPAGRNPGDAAGPAGWHPANRAEPARPDAGIPAASDASDGGSSGSKIPAAGPPAGRDPAPQVLPDLSTGGEGSR